MVTSSVKFNDNSKPRPKITSFAFNQSPMESNQSSHTMPANPLNPIACLNSNNGSNTLISLMPPPRTNVVFRNKHREAKNDDPDQTLQDTTLKNEESKENLFI